jgi:hypothetical protein
MRWGTRRFYVRRAAFRVLRVAPERFGDAFREAVDFAARFDFFHAALAADPFPALRAAALATGCPFLPAAIARFSDACLGASFRVASSNWRCSDPIIRPSDSADRSSSDSSWRGRRAGSSLPCLAIPDPSCAKERRQGVPADEERRQGVPGDAERR